MISLLQSLRFIFAIMIFLHHYPVDGTGWFKAGGSCGVLFFMAIEDGCLFLAILLTSYVVYNYYEIPVSKYIKRKIVCLK